MTRHILWAALLSAALAPAAALAQPKPAPPRPAETAPAPVDEQGARETRDRLRQILDQYPPSVAQVLRLDPSLLSRADYLAPYPTLAAYVAQHSEVVHNPVFFLGEARFAAREGRTDGWRAIDDIFTSITTLFGVVSAMVIFGWLIRSGLDYRRWLRAMRIQTDAHTKIVDRLASNEDLIAYMQSPVGQRFLSASPAMPAASDLSVPMVGAPVNRILWSVQAGVVLTAAGIGLWIAKGGVFDEAAQALQVVAILAIALGVGSVVSALASWLLSRQLGLVQSRAADHA
jgi:hypothetical protein